VSPLGVAVHGMLRVVAGCCSLFVNPGPPAKPRPTSYERANEQMFVRSTPGALHRSRTLRDAKQRRTSLVGGERPGGKKIEGAGSNRG
jgi:hypothetical protein